METRERYHGAVAFSILWFIVAFLGITAIASLYNLPGFLAYGWLGSIAITMGLDYVLFSSNRHWADTIIASDYWLGQWPRIGIAMIGKSNQLQLYTHYGTPMILTQETLDELVELQRTYHQKNIALKQALVESRQTELYEAIAAAELREIA